MSKLITSIEKPALNLNQLHFKSTINGIVVMGTWLREGRRFQPCLVLLHPSRPIAAGRTVPVVIKLSEAWVWAMHGDVGNPLHCVLAMNEWFRDGLLPGQIGNRKDHMRVLDAINQRLPDLIAMPPRPKGEQVAVAEVTLINKSTGEITERELKDDV